MTCIVAFLDRKTGMPTVGADSCISEIGNNDQFDALYPPKIWKSGFALLGGAGIYQQIQAIRLSVHLSKTKPKNLERYLVQTVLPAVETVLEDLDPEKEKDEDSKTGWILLLATKGAIATVDNTKTVILYQHPYLAVGTGAHYALGSLHRSQYLQQSAQESCLYALQAAAEHCCTVRPPFSFLSMLSGGRTTRGQG